MRLGLKTSALALFLPPQDVELCRHDLAIALRFVDPFVLTAPPVQAFRRAAVPDLHLVRISSLEWEAGYERSDGTYRFSSSNARLDVAWQGAVIFGIAHAPEFPTVPVTLSVEVSAVEPTRARYFVPSPISISLPVPPGPFVTPQQQLASYLKEIEAYPTPLLRAPPGETYIRGLVRDGSSVARPGMEVAVYDGTTLPANAVFTRTDAAGFFGYRLPWLKRPVPVPGSPSLGITVRPIGGTTFASIVANPHPATDPARALFSYGVTTTVAIQAQ